MKSILSRSVTVTALLWFTACASTVGSKATQQPPQTKLSVAMTDHQIQMAGFREAAIASGDLAGYRPLQRVLVMLANDEQIKRLEKVAPGVEFVGSSGIEPGKDVEGPFDAVILACGQDVALDYAQDVAWIHSYSAGVEKCLAHPTLRKMDAANQDYIITNSSGTAASIIGEHAIAMMMSFARGLHHFRDAQSKRQWARNMATQASLTTTVGGKTMLVLGLGSIGKEVARRAHALGMRVIATRNRSKSGPDYVDYVGLSDETLELTRQADVIVNALPLTDLTRGLLDTEFFKAMKNSALLVSVGRGGTTDTDALLAALDAGELAGAALDVTDPEPLPEDHPLWRQKNVIITPHLAGTGGDARARVAELLLENIRRYQAGERLLNPVSSKAGY